MNNISSYMPNILHKNNGRKDSKWCTHAEMLLDAVNRDRKKAGYTPINYARLGKKIKEAGYSKNIDQLYYQCEHKALNDGISIGFAFNILTKK